MNTCMSRMTINHCQPVMIERIVLAYMTNCLFGDFIPCPIELLNKTPSMLDDESFLLDGVNRFPSLYDWRLQNWGSQIDCGVRDVFNCLTVESEGKLTLEIWTPSPEPFPIFDHWVSLGYQVYGTTYGDEGETRYEYADGVATQIGGSGIRKDSASPNFSEALSKPIFKKRSQDDF